MKTITRISIVAALVVTVAAVLGLKNSKRATVASIVAPSVAATATALDTNRNGSVAATKLPKLLDVGAGKCIPCKMMAPILEELKEEYAGRMAVEFIDVWVDPDAAKPYGIEVIPTQIFYDAEGIELFRHVGFFGKEDILDKWRELGVDVRTKPVANK
jgi:thioredoxin 1